MMRYCFLFAFVLGCTFAAAAQTAHKGEPPASKAPPEEQLYRNTTFGFSYKIPYGWVERTKEMREPAQPKADSTDAPDTNSSSSSSRAAARDKSAKEKPAIASDVLLAVFERPPEAAGESVNSAVVIASEPVSGYHGLKKAEDFLAPLTELIVAQGFKVEGDPSMVEIDGRELLRADFAKSLTDKLSMRQTTLVLLAKGQIVSFTFVAGSADEVDDLIENLGFMRKRVK